MANTIIDGFFAAFGSGGAEAALKLITPDAIFEAQGPPSVPIYGRFEGYDGVRRFIATLRELFDTERFEVRQSTQSGDIAFAYGACGGPGRCSVRSGPSTVRCVMAASVLTRCLRTPPHSPLLTADRLP
jgi:ketosteroid isomerase-like protein